MGRSLAEIAAVTRIPVRSLERLERGAFEELPADVFVRGFLRSYAQCVGLDQDEAIQRYTACGMAPAPVASPMAKELANTMATLESSHSAGYRSIKATPARLSTVHPDESDASDERVTAGKGTHVQAGESVQPAMGDIEDDSASANPASAPGLIAAITPDAGAGETSEMTEGEVAHDAVELAPENAVSEERPHDDARPLSECESTANDVESRATVGKTVENTTAAGGERRGSRKRKRKRRKRKPVQAQPRVSGHVSRHGDNTSPDEVNTVTSSSIEACAPAADVDVLSTGEPVTDDDEALVSRRPSTRRSNGRYPTLASATHRVRQESSKPVLVMRIDDEHPDDAEQIHDNITSDDDVREEGAWKHFLPPALLDSEEGSRRGALTLAVIILVIVATLTMSYLMRRPNDSGDGVTQRQQIHTPANISTMGVSGVVIGDREPFGITWDTEPTTIVDDSTIITPIG